MKIKVLEQYYDRELEAYKNPGDELDVTKERAAKLISMKLAEERKEEETGEPVEEAVKPAAPKRSTAKRTKK